MPRLGINLSGLNDWNSELPFVNLFLQSRPWISQRAGAGWAMGEPLDVDPRGWVKSLRQGQFADAPTASVQGGQYPGGLYHAYFDGVGQLDFWGGARVVGRSAGQAMLEVTPSRGPIWLRLKATDPADPIRNIRVHLPGHKQSVARHAFNPSFLRRWQGVDCVRFMDWMRTNGSEQRSWTDRPTIDDATFSARGCPVEVMVNLANELRANPWFCMPHLANDDYVRQFAKVVKQQLSPNLKIYIELSNELWNGAFAQGRHVLAAAREKGVPVPTWIAMQSIRVFDIWEQVFAGSQRLIRIAPSQAANTWLSRQVLGAVNMRLKADALAIAPYLDLSLTPSGKEPNALEVRRWTVDQLLDHVESKVLPTSISWMKEQREIADSFGIAMVAYEGGQHFVGVLGAENDDNLSALLQSANMHPRIENIYRRYLDEWAKVGGLLCHFCSVESWTKWGSWGLLRNSLEEPASSPKFKAVASWAARFGQRLSMS